MPGLPEQTSEARWLLAQSVVIVALWLLWVLLMDWFPQPFAQPLLRGLVRILLLLLPAVWFLRRSQTSWVDGWFLRANWPRGVFVGLAVGAIVVTFFYLAQVRGTAVTWQLPQKFDSWFNWILGSPFAEEVWFRAVLFGEINRKNGLIYALLGSSLMFGLLHLPTWIILEGMPASAIAQSFGNIVLYGVVFALLFKMTGSLWASLLPHWLNNLFIQGLQP